jgi:hypothetical protein
MGNFNGLHGGKTVICPQTIKASSHPAAQFTIIGIQFRDQGVGIGELETPG